jgi:MarR family transcriptional regulator, multiple antibiotic resistance protein MarR
MSRADIRAVPGGVAAVTRETQGPGIPEDEMVIGHLIGRARTALLTGMDSELEPFGLTGAQFAVLKNVADGAANTAADLCRTMHYDTGSMTRMLDRLEEKAVLRRERCTEDRRVVFLRITESGNELLPQLRTAVARVLTRHLASFSPTEVDAFKQFLIRMIQNGQQGAS